MESVEKVSYMLALEELVAPERARLLARLEDLGYAKLTEYPYEEYLTSALWKKIRGFVRERDGFKCQVCWNGISQRKGVDLDVHHRSYDLATLESRRSEQLLSVCRRCHDHVEHHVNGTRRYDLAEKELRLTELIAVHLRIRTEGMPVRIMQAKKNLFVEYVGDPVFLAFHPLSGLLHAFVLDTWVAYRPQTHLPRHGIVALDQRTGLKLRDARDKRAWLTARRIEPHLGTVKLGPAGDLIGAEVVTTLFARERNSPFYWRRADSASQG